MKKYLVPLLVLSLITVGLFTSCSNDNQPSPSLEATVSSTSSPSYSAEATETAADNFEVSPGVMLVDFENENTGIAFFDLSQYGFMTPQPVFETGDSVQSGKGIRLDINYTPAYGVISLQIQNEAGNITQGFNQANDYDYLRFWVNNQSESDVSIAVILVVDEPLKNGCLDPEGAKIISSSGKEESIFTSDAADVNNTNGTGNTSLDIPAEFVGWVYYPLNQQVPWWEGTTLSAEELANVSTINMDIRFTDASLADHIIIDDISLANPET